jgi:2-polyprenyl-6-methoxyphenol hydroxylase-like FAD-dependent oxidoreductase
VGFERSSPRRFDLVVGAAGLHSNVRALAFGPEPRFVRHLGYSVATFRAPNLLGLDHAGVVYSEPGKAVSVSSARHRDEAVVMLVQAGSVTRDPDALRARFAGAGWETPRLLAHIENDLYADDVSRVDVDGFSRGRVALLGDACTGATVGGQGTGVAVVGAYVLAGELAKTHDHAQAFARYEATIAKWARGCQDTARHMGPFFAPKTRRGLAVRNIAYRALTSRLLSPVLEKLFASSASNFVVPAYAA